MRNASDNDNQGKGSKPERECQIWGKKNSEIKKNKTKTDYLFQVYVSCV